MHTLTTLTDCHDCNDGLVDCSSDHMDSRGEHYTRDWQEPCERCDGTGRLEIDAAELHVEMALDFDAADEPLFVGALTEADLERFAAAEAPTALHLACQEYLDAGHGDPSHFVAVAS